MAKREPSVLLIKNGRNIIFKNISADDADNFLEFRRLIPHESTHTMQVAWMEFPTKEVTAKRLQAQQDDKTVLNIGAFYSRKIVGYLNF